MPPPRTLILALGNDVISDDAVALHAAREIRKHVNLEEVAVIESGEAGLALIELMTGYERCIILDAIKTGGHPVGTILEFGPDDFRKVTAPSPHYAGLPEILETAKKFQLPMPKDIQVLALEVENLCDLKEALTPSVANALPAFIEVVLQKVPLSARGVA